MTASLPPSAASDPRIPGQAAGSRKVPPDHSWVLAEAVNELAAADSGLRLLESAAGWAARLAGVPCIILLDGLEASAHVAASGNEGSIDPSLGRLLSSPASSRRWLPAEAVGLPAGDPPVRPAARFALAADAHAQSLGELVLFEIAGSTSELTTGPTAGGVEAARTIALLTGALLAGGPGGRCACAANVERARIMAELHDGLLQSLYGIGLDVQAKSRRPLPDDARRTLHRWSREIARAIDDTRRYLDTLNAPDAAVPELGAGLDEAAGPVAAAGIDAEIDVTIDPGIRLTPAARQVVLRIAREALSNVTRHSRAGRVIVSLEVTWQRLALRIQDDGVGFDAGTVDGGHGLQIMATRAAALECTLEVASEPGRGTRIEVSGPLPPKAASLQCPDCGSGETCCLSAS